MDVNSFTLQADPDKVADLLIRLDGTRFPDWNAHPLWSDFQLALYRQIHPAGHRDSSFTIVCKNEPILVVRGTLADGGFSSFGLPAMFCFRDDLTPPEALQAGRLAFKHLSKLIPENEDRTVLWRGPDLERGQGPVDELGAQMRATGELRCHASAALDKDETQLMKGLRDSFRQNVRWGQKQMRLEYFNRDNPDPATFGRYPEFHARVAGGTKRGDDYWQVYFDEIAAGRGELSLGFLQDGTLAAGSIVIDRGTTSYYASGVYDRDLFPKPVSHWPVFDSMLRAKQRGMARFDLGEVTPRAAAASTKEADIGHFKRGFSPDSSLHLVWTWRPNIA
jgi:hypothetical protein